MPENRNSSTPMEQSITKRFIRMRCKLFVKHGWTRA